MVAKDSSCVADTLVFPTLTTHWGAATSELFTPASVHDVRMLPSGQSTCVIKAVCILHVALLSANS